MTMDFSGNAGAASPFDLLPNGQLAYAILNVRGVKASASGGGYLDCELTICEGQPYAGRKLWDMIGDPNNAGNSEKYRQMGTIAITRILEAGRGAGPNNPSGYQINSYQDLDGLKVPIKVGVEPGTGGHDDKNRVAEYLTPNPASQSGHKGFALLASGTFNAAAAAAPAPASGFGAPAGAAGAPAGFGNAPAATAAPAGFGAPAAAAPAGGGFGGQPTAPDGGAAPGFPVAQQPGVVETATPQSDPAQSQPQTVAATGASSPSNPGDTPQWLSQADPQA